MHPDFSRSLSLLRQERGISQRVAAKDLQISQALLSHYENGIREPGLAFLNRVCDYYNVSADFLLGRTLSRQGMALSPEDAQATSADSDALLNSGLMAALQAKMLSGILSLLFDLLGKTGSRPAIESASAYLGTALYVLFRHLYSFSQANERDAGFFSTLSSLAFLSGAPQGDMALSEVKYTAALTELIEANGVPLPLDHIGLERAYQAAYPSLSHILESASNRMRQRLEPR